MLPAKLVKPLFAHLERVQRQHQRDLKMGAGSIALPFAFAGKNPSAATTWAWQWVFPATRLYVDRDSGLRRRHHLHESVVQRAIREAVRLAGIRTAAIIMPISRERNDSDYCLNSSYSLSWRTLLCIITNVA